MLVVMLFTQLAMSAYACPAVEASLSGTVAQASMPDCDMAGTMDPDQPQLCRAHWLQDSLAALATHGTDTQPPAPPLLLATLDWTQVLLAPQGRASQPAPVATGAPPPGAPPIYLSLLVLRN